MRRTFVVGDVHGCLGELEALLKVAGVTADDSLIFVGDLVAKGPDSQGVVQLARERKALAVLGNHDDAVLNAREKTDVNRHHVQVAQSLATADWQYLERLPLWVDLPDENALVVHAGLLPKVSLDQQPRHLLLNMRSIRDDGTGSTRIEAHPWATRWPGPRFVVFGHDAVRGLQQERYATGLDTGCVYGKELTGLWLMERRLVSVKAQRVWQNPIHV